VTTLGTSVGDILERSSDAFVALDRDWRYVYVNERAGEMFGRRPRELIGRRIWTEFPEGVGQTFYHAYHRALEEQVFVRLEDYYPPWERWFENRIYPSPNGLTIFFQDITERKQAELALQERTESLDLALDAARAGTWTWELESGEVRWSGGVEAIVGLPANTFDDRFETYLELVHPDDRESHAAALRAALEGGDRVDVRHRILRPADGNVRWLEGTGRVFRDERGRAIRMAGVVQDVTERAETEAALRERERQLAEAQRVAHVGSFIWSVNDDRVTWSDELYRIYGLEPQESPATFEAFLRQIHVDDRAEVEETIRAALAGTAPLRMQERIVRPDGEIRNLSSWGEVVRDSAGAPLRLLGICQDVTEQRRREEALQASEERLRVLVESLRSHALIQLSSDGVIDTWNKGAERLLGWTADDVVGHRLAVLYPEEDRQAGRPEQTVATARNGRVEERRRLVREDGSHFWADATLTPLAGGRGFSYLVRDSTEQRAAELRRERLTERLNTLHEIDLAILGADSGATVAGVALSRLIALLPGSAAQLVAVDEATRRPALIAAEPAAFALVEPLAAGAAGGCRPTLVTDLSAGAATERASLLAGAGWRSLLDAPLIANGRHIGALTLVSREPGAYDDEDVAVVREVVAQLAVAIQQSEYRERIQRHSEELEHRVIERTQELEEANAELESFSYSVAHDLRAPLRAVQGLTQALVEDYASELDETGRDYGERIIGAVKRMDLLIQDLLAYAKLSRSDPRLGPVSLVAVVRDVLAQQELEMSSRHATVDVAEPLPDVVGHHATLVQVVGNLVSNALKFVAPGTLPRVAIRAEHARGRVRLWVEDNGIGIEPAHQARIFRVFERLHGVESYPGTGIGLAIVRKGMDRLGGSSCVESAPGRGSRFCVDLPAVNSDGR
jgi:PAS domain S-box-containing protein